MFEIAVVFLVVTALMAYVNRRFIGLPDTIGVMVVAMLVSFSLIGLDALGVATFREHATALLRSVDFSEVLMQGMLSMLLFAGALHVDLSELHNYRWQVGLLAVGGTLVSTIIVAYGLYWLLPMLGLPLALPWCLVFGALISPTDPIAVMGILKSARAPKSLELVISGESLFNDGVGVVLFVLLLEAASMGDTPGAGEVAKLAVHEVGGGLLLGGILGYATYRLLKSIDSYQEEVLITLAAVLGGYALANRLHVSGPLAMVVAGLIVGNRGRRLGMSDTTRKYHDLFWALLDSILNAVLFVLIGLEVLVVPFSLALLGAAALTIAVTLLARLVAVGTPIAVLRSGFGLPRGSWKVLTWGGLRGGISVALVLSLPAGETRDMLLGITYVVVVFSILVQGLTIGRVARSLPISQAPPRPDASDPHAH
ncbi:sodium:proton antiporter [Pseudoxanthomonas sp. JBR18]|uniref:cation:proton antiporter n=1 Tax=Pseudoxanthomonas sp. JBR18 TaxID=2969308 RepID=UPI002304F4C6|nr:sodium:proton antiporter [Pseudoxanthomonas sp. JBR18]WCE03665.1 sodium:proton antiporter [Pseudoxanthomonas sp. JBR18]